MSVRMRHTKGHTRNRRSHHALKTPRLSKCPSCGSLHLRHRVCETCGNYRGRLVIDVMAKIEKKTERIKAKKRALGQEIEPEKKEKKLSAETLSKKAETLKTKMKAKVSKKEK